MPRSAALATLVLVAVVFTAGCTDDGGSTAPQAAESPTPSESEKPSESPAAREAGPTRILKVDYANTGDARRPQMTLQSSDGETVKVSEVSGPGVGSWVSGTDLSRGDYVLSVERRAPAADDTRGFVESCRRQVSVRDDWSYLVTFEQGESCRIRLNGILN
jgi:hypothetical protein